MSTLELKLLRRRVEELELANSEWKERILEVDRRQKAAIAHLEDLGEVFLARRVEAVLSGRDPYDA